MMLRRWKFLVSAFAALLFGALVIWPMVDRQLMEIPFSDGIAALKNSDVDKLAMSFTPDARFVTTSDAVTVNGLLLRLSSRLKAEPEAVSLRFDGYTNIQHHGSIVHADATFIYSVHEEDYPYGAIPSRWTEDVTLEKQGLFRWKIKEIRLHNDALNSAYQRWAAMGTHGE